MLKFAFLDHKCDFLGRRKGLGVLADSLVAAFEDVDDLLGRYNIGCTPIGATIATVASAATIAVPMVVAVCL